MASVTPLAVSKCEFLSVFGSDCPPPNAPGVHDYSRLVDLPQHPLETLRCQNAWHQSITENLGTDRGSSVKELANIFSLVNAVAVPSPFFDSSAGDIASCYANPSLAQHKLGWRAPLNGERMCLDTWQWPSMIPNCFC